MSNSSQSGGNIGEPGVCQHVVLEIDGAGRQHDQEPDHLLQANRVAYHLAQAAAHELVLHRRPVSLRSGRRRHRRCPRRWQSGQSFKRLSPQLSVSTSSMMTKVVAGFLFSTCSSKSVAPSISSSFWAGVAPSLVMRIFTYGMAVVLMGQSGGLHRAAGAIRRRFSDIELTRRTSASHFGQHVGPRQTRFFLRVRKRVSRFRHVQFTGGTGANYLGLDLGTGDGRSGREFAGIVCFGDVERAGSARPALRRALVRGSHFGRRRACRRRWRRWQ